MRKSAFCICENKGELSCSVTAKLISTFVFATRDGYYNSSSSKIGNLKLSYVATKPDLCQTCSENTLLVFS